MLKMVVLVAVKMVVKAMKWLTVPVVKEDSHSSGKNISSPGDEGDSHMEVDLGMFGMVLYLVHEGDGMIYKAFRSVYVTVHPLGDFRGVLNNHVAGKTPMA